MAIDRQLGGDRLEQQRKQVFRFGCGIVLSASSVDARLK